MACRLYNLHIIKDLVLSKSGDFAKLYVLSHSAYLYPFFSIRRNWQQAFL